MAQLEKLTGQLSYEYDGSGLRIAAKDLEALGIKAAGMGQKASGGLTAMKVAGVAAGVAMTGVGLAAAGVGVGLAKSVGAAANFEAGLSNIKAVSDATAQEMDQVKEAALRIGAETSFSAQEAAGAIEELVKAGVSVEGVLNGAADAAVALAAAGEVDMATAAAVAGAAMNNFALDAEELPKVADLIAGAANASAISVEDFAFSLQASGAAANLAGFSFDDLAVGITAMGNAGIKGSDAGTSLKTFMMNLIPTTKAQIAAFDELGLTLEDGSNAFFDAQGNVKSMAEVAGILQNATKDLTAEQKLATLETLFGSDAIRAAAVIAEEGAAGMDSLAESMGKVTAAEVAEERLNNLKGSVEAFWGSLETLQIKAGDAFLPILKLLTDFGTEALNALGPVLDQIAPKIEAFFGGIDVKSLMDGLFGGGGLGGVDLSGLGGQFATIGENLRAAFVNPEMQLFIENLMIRLKDIGAFIVDPLIPAAVDFGVTLSEYLRMVVPPALDFFNALHDDLWPIIVQIFDFIRDNRETITSTFSDALMPVMVLKDGLDGLKGAVSGFSLGGLFGGGEAEEEAEAAGAEAGLGFAAGLRQAIDGFSSSEAPDMATRLADSLAGVGGEETPPFIAKWAGALRDFGYQTEQFGLGPLDALANTLQNMGEFNGDETLGSWGLALADLSNVFAGVQEDIAGWAASAEATLDSAWSSIQSGIDSAWAQFDSTIQSAQDAIYSYLMDIWMQIPEDIRADLVLIAEHIREQFEQYRADIEAKLQEAKDGITEWLDGVKDAWDDWLDGIVTAASDAWEDVKAAIMEPLTEARTELSTAWASVEAEARAAWSRVQGAISDAVQQALAVLTGIKDQIEQKARDAWSQVVSAASTALAPLTNAVTEKVNAALAYLSGVRDTVEGKARDIWQGFMDATERVLAGFKDTVLTPIRTAIEGIKTGVASAVARASEVGAEIVNGIKRGIDTRLAALKSSFWDSIRGILDWLKGLLGIASPSRVFAEIGMQMMAGLAQGIEDGAGLAQAALGSAFARLVTGDPGGTIAAAVDDMGRLYDEWRRLAELAAAFNADDPLAGPIRRMNDALSAFFDGGAAGSLSNLLALMAASGFRPDEAGLLERMGFSERSFEEIQRSIEALSGEPDRQRELWGDFIEALMGDWERFYESQKAPLEEQKRQLERLKKQYERDPNRTGTELDPQIEAVQALIDEWEFANESIQRALSGQEDSVDGIAAAYKRVLDAVRAVNGAAEDAEDAYQAALKAAQAAVKAVGEAAEDAEDGAHDRAMALLDAEMRRRELAHKRMLSWLEERQEALEETVERENALEEQAHLARLAAITAEVDALDAANEARSEGIDKAKEFIALVEAGLTLTQEQADYLRSMGIDPDALVKAATGIGETKTEIERLTKSVALLKGLFDALPDEIGRVRMVAGELRREFGRRPGSRDERTGESVSDAERARLEQMLAGGGLSKSDQRIIEVFLAGGAVQAERLRRILGPQIGAEEKAIESAQAKVDLVKAEADLAGDILAKLEAQLAVDERIAKERRESLAGAIEAEKARHERFLESQAARVAAIEAEREAIEDAYTAEREALEEAKRIEEERHDERMRQIQEEYALQLLMLGKTEEEIAAILDEQRRRAAAISEEAEQRFKDMLARAGFIASGGAIVDPGRQTKGEPVPTPPGGGPIIDPGGRQGPKGTGPMTLGEMFGDMAAAFATAAPALTAFSEAFAGGGGGSAALTRDLTNYGVIMVGDQGAIDRDFRDALLAFLGV